MPCLPRNHELRGAVMLFDVALEEAVKWAVPTLLAAGSGWWLVKRKAIKAWREKRAARKAAFDNMLTGFPDLQRVVAGVEKQVRPNGGGSLMDAVCRIEASSKTHGEAISDIRASLVSIDAMVRAQSDLGSEGAFACDPEGRNDWVNQAYARMLGVGRADLLGNQWKNYIHPDDAGAFLAANASALHEHRMFSGRCRMVRSDGDDIEVDVTIIPYPDRPPAKRWFGKVRLLA